MNGNRAPWTISIVSLLVALIACFIAFSTRVAAQDPEPLGASPVVAMPVDGALDLEPAQVDPAAVDATLTNAFTYQGVLKSGSAPASGSYDFQLQLFNAITGGTQRGSTLVAENVPVSQGHFTTILNFGNVFGNEALWIAVGVRGGTSTGAFTALNPRQSLTAVPFAASTPALAARVAALETLFAGVTRVDGGATIRISNANLQVVSGSGTTNGAVNGRGNIIVGYNEPTSPAGSRNGSHMIVVGSQNNYNSYGGVVFGSSNYANSPYASVLGGSGNIADGNMAAVVGGKTNHASGNGAVVVGGETNSASSQSTVVTGGQSNLASGISSVVTGGTQNQAIGATSAVVGGYNNIAEGNNSVLVGGQSNKTDDTGDTSVVVGGNSNRATGLTSVIGGGVNNLANASYATVSGGRFNVANGLYVTVGGGLYIEPTYTFDGAWLGNNYVCVPNFLDGTGCGS